MTRIYPFLQYIFDEMESKKLSKKIIQKFSNVFLGYHLTKN